MRTPLTSNLRFGWTTGTCAAAALYASYTAFVTGNFPKNVEILTPSGKIACLDIINPRLSSDNSSGQQRFASAWVIKDAGDDPDVTHGAHIQASITNSQDGAGISFHAGEGVGMVTKPGLPIMVGEAAINPVPRKMMTDIIEKLAGELGGPLDIEVTISVAGGEALAKKTWNPRLGIIGGISILGTSGVVRPYSCSAWIASIHSGVDVARANGLPHMIASTGSTSEASLRQIYKVEDIACLDMGDFIGGLLKYVRRHPLPRLSIGGGVGKMVKFAQGAVDLHSARSQVNFGLLAELAGKAGMNPERVGGANTVLEVMQMASTKERGTLCQLIAEQAYERAVKLVALGCPEIDILVIDRKGRCLAKAGGPALPVS